MKIKLNSPMGGSLTWIAAICSHQPPDGSSQLVYTVEETTNSETFKHFLAVLERHFNKFDDDQQLVMVMDRHGTHKGPQFDQWLS